MLMARSTYKGMKMANENKRPFVLTRAGFIGSQRYAATWTGDNLSNWEHLHMCIPMVLQLGLSGQPLSGPDVGGFAGNATPRLFGRWMGVGAMFPFCRAHSESGTIDQEPWSFGEEDLPILYLQGGSIIPVGPAIQHIGEANPTNELSLFISLDINGNIYCYYVKNTAEGFWQAKKQTNSCVLLTLGAEGVLFEDDGDGYGYTQGAYLLTYYAAELKSSTVTVRVSQTEGSWKRPNRSLHVFILLGEGAMSLISTLSVTIELLGLCVFHVNWVQSYGADDAKLLPDVDDLSGQKGIELSKTPVDIKSRDWQLKVVPWIGGRMISMIHLPSGNN
ncbi:putative alpha-glucosidase [Dendrobium catenatum]|uniref:Putative alpha-glucosidase n=1 Tax=Dendrobium catenatum TaxID=906689 RepID=A0A2I0V9P4_9ASPA|nr:putative alpha-glucosidase [Dendrobium catenatum]